jgi:hypothetical protein
MCVCIYIYILIFCIHILLLCPTPLSLSLTIAFPLYLYLYLTNVEFILLKMIKYLKLISLPACGALAPHGFSPPRRRATQTQSSHRSISSLLPVNSRLLRLATVSSTVTISQSNEGKIAMHSKFFIPLLKPPIFVK